ncbi:MAG: succinate dehydrogenase flavoprotein subunit [Selenomonas sp.]|nr:succinate dehydrogenase flavoprotein subunit [Selenomonas ruminantium]MBQ7496311.1 succinate dehydrogenase flavoprotein subunit [Selenomonas sp.]
MAKAPENKIIVVGGGLSGLMATMKICEGGGKVDLFSYCPVKRSHSLCAQGGINACMDTKGEHDSIYEHFDDTVYGGDFLADQLAVKGMVEAAPKLIKMFDRMGVPFTRTPEGVLDLRNFGGQKNKRTCFAGSTTGQQLLYALDEQVRHWEVKGKVTKYEFWEFIKVIKNKQGVVRGIVAQNMNSNEIVAFPADVVILATGGPGMVFGRCTASTICNGSAVTSVYKDGAHLANPEFIQIHPTAIPGPDKNRLMSEACRGEGGRVWVWRDNPETGEKERWYFLEDMYPAYGNLVPRDVASRAIYKVCVHMGLGMHEPNRVYLDLSHIPKDYLERKLGGILEMYEDFVGKSPAEVPMEIFPSVHYSMGGIWVDRMHHTNIPGLMASGECDYQYHGANRLGANSLLSATYSGTVSGPEALRWARSGELGDPLTEAEMEAARKECVAEFDKIRNMNGPENAHKLHHEMGEIMYKYVSIERDNIGLDQCLKELKEILKRWDNIGVTDHGNWANQEAMFVRQLRNMILYAMVVTKGARCRDESRGAHAKIVLDENGNRKTDEQGELVFMGRDDERFMKTTIVDYDPKTEEPQVSYMEFDHSLIKPRARNYAVAKKE